MPAPSTSATVPDDMMMRSPDVGFECGGISALNGIAFRSQWEYENGVIDAAAFESRQAALADAWNYMLVGQTQVAPAIREAQQAVRDAASLSTPEAQAAIGALTAACDEAGSLVGVGALPEMGG
ncbi:hypothetical protein ACFXQA_11330 [Microbacterium sp. P07]|uniref:hypothetical protein n=1 Tax=Microbacterium sp. P07 TaxID=3366952 RepID=UPI003745F8D8